MSRNKLYLGKAGQYLAMAEFLIRGWNVAIPEVDIGDDIFVVKDSTGEYTRIQVKTSKTKGDKVQYRLSYKQLEQTFTPDLIYFFVIRNTNTRLNDLIIIKRDELFAKIQVDDVSSVSKDKKSVQLSFKINKNNEITCKSVDFTKYVNDFKSFPTIDHTITI